MSLFISITLRWNFCKKLGKLNINDIYTSGPIILTEHAYDAHAISWTSHGRIISIQITSCVYWCTGKNVCGFTVFHDFTVLPYIEQKLDMTFVQTNQ